MGKGGGVAQEADVAIRLLIESGCAKTPSEAAVPAFSGWLLTRFGGVAEEAVAGGGDVVQRKEGGRAMRRRGISTKKKKTEKDRDGGTRRKRSEAKRCGAVAVQSS